MENESKKIKTESLARMTGQKKTVHVLSNDLPLIGMMNRIFYSLGYSMIYSHDYPSVLTNIRLFPSDIIVIDCDMSPSYCRNIFRHIGGMNPEAVILPVISRLCPLTAPDRFPSEPAHIFHKPLSADMFYQIVKRIVQPAGEDLPGIAEQHPKRKSTI